MIWSDRAKYADKWKSGGAYEKKDYRTVSGAGNVFVITARVGMGRRRRTGQ